MAHDYFNYGRISDDVLSEGGDQYLFWCQMLYSLIDNQNAYYVHYPYPGGYLEQGAITMFILDIIKNEYIDYLKSKQK